MQTGDGLFPLALGLGVAERLRRGLPACLMDATGRVRSGAHAGTALVYQFSLKCSFGSRHGCPLAFAFGPSGYHVEAIAVE